MRDIVIDPKYLDVTVPVGTEFIHPVKLHHTTFAYVFEGKGYFDNERDAFAHEVVGENYFDFDRKCVCDPESLIPYEDGKHVSITATEETLRFLLMSGKPIGEPVAWYGLIVMNTQEELQIAFEEYQKGTFIRHKKPIRG